MKVKDCKGCPFCKRRVWVSIYTPANYHTIGVSHAFHRCEKAGKRCLDVKKCPKEGTT